MYCSRMAVNSGCNRDYNTIVSLFNVSDNIEDGCGGGHIGHCRSMALAVVVSRIATKWSCWGEAGHQQEVLFCQQWWS